MVLSRLSACFAASAMLLAMPAVADEPHAHDHRLVVEMSRSAAESCPPRVGLASAVVSRLGYDPFAVEGTSLVLVDITRERTQLLARVRILAPDGAPQGSRELQAALGECADLIASAALTIAIAIDPLALSGRRSPAASTAKTALPALPPPSQGPPEPERIAEPAATVEPVFPAPARREIARVGAGVLGAVGSAPSPTAGFMIAGEVALAQQRFHLGLEARGDLPASGDGAPGRVVASLLVADVSGCWGRSVLACAIVTAGASRVSSAGVERPQTELPFFAAAGLRAAMEVAVGSSFALRPYLEAEAIATRHTLRIDGQARFTYAPVMAAAGIAFYFSHVD